MDSIFDLDHLYRTYFKMALPSVFGHQHQDNRL